MVPKCGYIRRAVAAARKDGPYITELDLSSIPGGADAFEKALSVDGPVVIDTYIDKDEFVLPMLPPGGSVDEIITKVEKE